APPREEPATEGPPAVRSVHAARRGGRDRVGIALTRPAEVRTSPRASGPARLVLRGVRVRQSAPRRLSGDGDESAARGVRVLDRSGRTIIEVERRAGARGTAIREGNRIVWLFSAPSPREARPRSRTISREAWADAGEGE